MSLSLSCCSDSSLESHSSSHLFSREIIYAAERIYLVMEFCARGELFQYIVKNGRVREDEGRRFFSQVIQGRGR